MPLSTIGEIVGGVIGSTTPGTVPGMMAGVVIGATLGQVFEIEGKIKKSDALARIEADAKAALEAKMYQYFSPINVGWHFLLSSTNNDDGEKAFLSDFANCALEIEKNIGAEYPEYIIDFILRDLTVHCKREYFLFPRLSMSLKKNP